jgi:ribosomal protein S18 acetylase RimI-like enzyme
VQTREYAEPDDLARMQALAWICRSRDPLLVDSPGELAWLAREHIGREPEWRRRLWLEGDEPVAWGWLWLPGELGWQVHPERPELFEEVLDWFEEEAQGPLELNVRDVDRDALERVRARGFEYVEDAMWMVVLQRDLGDVPEAKPPNGFTLRSLRGEEDVPARVEVHRAAFAPSRVTVESYLNVVRTPPYRYDLDCVAESPDGSFASFTLAWLEGGRMGAFEPVGTHPDHRRRGLARAVNLFALRRLRDAGAELVTVMCRVDGEHSAPKLLYESVGFRHGARTLPFRRMR